MFWGDPQLMYWGDPGATQGLGSFAEVGGRVQGRVSKGQGRLSFAVIMYVCVFSSQPKFLEFWKFPI